LLFTRFWTLVGSIAIALVLLTRVAAADGTRSLHLRGRVSDVKHGGPVEGAQVHVFDPHGDERVVISRGDGHYEIDVAPGEHEVVFVFGKSRLPTRVTVEPGQDAVLDGKVDSTSGEVIEISDPRAPAVMPRATNHVKSRAPPYSDEMIGKDIWTRAWLLLDVQASGEVTQFKFLKRPGHGLDRIAADEAFKLRFEPGRNEQGKPIRVWLIWLIEWPSNAWLTAMHLTRTMMPTARMIRSVPCRGSGPWRMGSRYPTYRDCSEPDLSRAPHEPWIPRPTPRR
jgi:hypothetical protein